MKTVLLDVSAVTSAAELHALLKEALALPHWYGNNLDALYDCLTDLCEDTCLTLTGTQTLVLPRREAFVRTLADAAEENPHFTFSLQ